MKQMILMDQEKSKQKTPKSRLLSLLVIIKIKYHNYDIIFQNYVYFCYWYC